MFDIEAYFQLKHKNYNLLISIRYLFPLFFQSWDSFFRNSAQGGAGYQAPPSLAPLGRNEIPVGALIPMMGGSSALGTGQISEKVIDDHLAVQAIIRSYQVRIAYFLHKWDLF